MALQRNIDYVCGLGLDCWPIKKGGPCFLPDTVEAHSAYAMNLFYQTMGKHKFDCDFDKTGKITAIDPSMFYNLNYFILLINFVLLTINLCLIFAGYGNCEYPAGTFV